MKVRWRQHEMILVTMIGGVLIAGYWWDMSSISASQLAEPFIKNNVSFNIYKNVLIPDIGVGILAYLTYIFLNVFTIPRIFYPKKNETGTLKISLSFKQIILQGTAKKMVVNFAWLILQLIFIVTLLGTALNVAIYFKHQWQFNYPEFSIFFNTNNPKSQINIPVAYAGISFIIAMYIIYVVVREFIISRIINSGSKTAFRTLISNQVTAFLVNYLFVVAFLITFRLLHEHHQGVNIFILAISVFLVYVSNTYWLFPLKEQTSFTDTRIISRLLISTFIFTLPSAISPFPGRFLAVLLICWAVQLFIVTPVTWIFYQQQKDKILQLRGAQKELIKSNAHLQFLRSQINPHFLFNILNTLYGTALQENAQLTAEGIQKLGDLMRFMLHENNLDFIPMEKEIQYLENYISLQKIRTQSSTEILIEDNISEQNCNHKIAPMLFIPLVENAFKHGISLKEKSWIKINLHCTEKEIVFEVRNSMHLRMDNDPEKEKSGIGFKNVIERLKLIYPGKHTITVNRDGNEFLVQLSIQP